MFVVVCFCANRSMQGCEKCPEDQLPYLMNGCCFLLLDFVGFGGFVVEGIATEEAC
jgi:hypothetical protein